VLDVRPGFLLNDDTQDVREYAAKQDMSEKDPLAQGVQAKAIEFVRADAELTSKA
jgi:phosphomethylpyrimidine synthase